MHERRAVHSLSVSHAPASQSLCEDPEIAALLGLSRSPSRDDVTRFIEERLAARNAGSAYVFLLTQGTTILGICGLLDAGSGTPPELMVATASGHRGAGHATFASERVLELAFVNLQLERIQAHPVMSHPACSRLLSRLGFSTTGGRAELTRGHWQDGRNRPALGALHPALSAILAAELAAGNEVAEMRTGWPKAGSVFVALRQSFLTRPPSLPEGIRYAELNDPHWWKAEYTSENPQHILASH